ncbi:MAG: prefoldin subunit alpha [Euryarchaeota archaeon]|nr:prefoldin subunit alpha [Euryarchaeota archaeon]OUW22108.1 MAG: prefoldin subunit alpha [Euryarchaeota archaeon TMED173]|tara:strand:+ start:721 stop:1239 length:519 start_codon:yes stop_codon:yes gene_type:complete
MAEADKADLQRLAHLVEVNRERLQALDQQIRNLESIRLEQEQAIEALHSISEEGAKGAMIPLGAGVQLIADIQPKGGAVVDIGSRIQAEKTRDEATEILRNRNNELKGILDTIRKEYEQLEEYIVSLAKTFNQAVEGLQGQEESSEILEKTQTPLPKRKTRRKRGTELTLDD